MNTSPRVKIAGVETLKKFWMDMFRSEWTLRFYLDDSFSWIILTWNIEGNQQPHSEDIPLSLRFFIFSFSHSKLYFFLQRNKSVLYGYMLCNTVIDVQNNNWRAFLSFFETGQNRSSPPNLIRRWILLINFELISNWRFPHCNTRSDAGQQIFCSN